MSDKIDWTTIAYGCSRYAQSQTIPADAEATVLFPNNIVTDTTGITYNNGVFTVSKAGWWMINAETGGSEGTNWHTTMIYVNGSEYTSNRTSNAAAGRINYCSTSCCVKLSAGDNFEVRARSMGAITINSRAKGNMSACLISPTS